MPNGISNSLGAFHAALEADPAPGDVSANSAPVRFNSLRKQPGLWRKQKVH